MALGKALNYPAYGGTMLGYKVIFYKHDETGRPRYINEVFRSRSAAQKWVKLIRANGYELHSIMREEVSEGARV